MEQRNNEIHLKIKIELVSEKIGKNHSVERLRITVGKFGKSPICPFPPKMNEN